MLDILKWLIKGLVLPPGGLLLLMLVGLVLWSRRPRLARVCLTAGVSLLWLAATPVVASAFEHWVSPARTLNDQSARQAQAIVIQAGGLRNSAFEFGGTTLGRLTIERVRYGAQLAKRLGLPVLVTGGSGESPDTEAELMKAMLEQEFGVPVRWVEQRSQNTRENAAESARLLRPHEPDGMRRILLVTHGFDLRRSRQIFEDAGFEVIPAPTMIAQANIASLADILPHVGAMERTYFVSYELMALGAAAAGLN